MKNAVSLRAVSTDDLEHFFRFQLDPDANRMAAFTAKDPADRAAFDAHWKRILGLNDVVVRTIVSEGEVVGHVAKFMSLGKPEITYWIAKEYWGKGIATMALSEFLTSTVIERPLFARAAEDNAASKRVLEKCGFAPCGEGKGFANARGMEVKESLFELKRL